MFRPDPFGEKRALREAQRSRALADVFASMGLSLPELEAGARPMSVKIAIAARLRSQVATKGDGLGMGEWGRGRRQPTRKTRDKRRKLPLRQAPHRPPGRLSLPVGARCPRRVSPRRGQGETCNNSR